MRLKDGSVPSLFGPTGSTESQTVSMINNICVYFLSTLKIQNYMTMSVTFLTHAVHGRPITMD